MEHAPTPARVSPPVDASLLAVAANRAAAAAAEASEPAQAIDAAVGALHEAIAGLLPSVFVFEHGRLWLVSQRGYAVVPDGLSVERGIMGRAVRLGRPQLVTGRSRRSRLRRDAPGDPDRARAAAPSGAAVSSVLSTSSRNALCPTARLACSSPSPRSLAPLAEELRRGRMLDLPALARLFVHLGSIRDPDEIAALGAASLPRVLPVEVSQVVVWDELGSPAELASWSEEGATQAPLTRAELEAARALADPAIVCEILELGGFGLQNRGTGSLVWLPLRANGTELGALVAIGRAGERVDPVQLDGAALLAAHVAASLDAAVSLQRERRSAVTDPLTGILNRRGLEERLDRELAIAQERRLPVSLFVIDCDDFKEINDRAGHEFGDALLHEVARVLTHAVPEGAEAARLGGDEFVVMLPGAGADAAEALGGEVRSVLAAGLTDAGFPLRISAGISTYPFDGATPERAPEGGRPGALLRQEQRQEPGRLVPRRRPRRARGDRDSDPRRGRGRAAPWSKRRVRAHRRRRCLGRDRGRDDGRRHLRSSLQVARLRRRRDRVLRVASRRRLPRGCDGARAARSLAGRRGRIPDLRLPADGRGAPDRPASRSVIPRRATSILPRHSSSASSG